MTCSGYSSWDKHPAKCLLFKKKWHVKISSWWGCWIRNPGGEGSARWTSASPGDLTQKRSKWVGFPSTPWVRTHTDTRAQDPELSLPEETLMSLSTWSGTSNHQLPKPSAFSREKEMIMSCIRGAAGGRGGFSRCREMGRPITLWFPLTFSVDTERCFLTQAKALVATQDVRNPFDTVPHKTHEKGNKYPYCLSQTFAAKQEIKHSLL